MLKLLMWCCGVCLLTVPVPISWITSATHDFGEIPYRQAVEHTFVFQNSGTDTLYIDNVRPACGCTTPFWQDFAIPPDSTGSIQVAYDAKDEGYFLKKIKVFFSSQRMAEILWIEGDVIKKE